MTDYPARSPAVDINPVEDGYVVYDPDTDLVHYLNHTAAIVLELCDGQRSAGQITAFLQDSYPSARDVAGSVQACLGQLRDLGLVQQPAASAHAIPAQARATEQVRPRRLSG